jgi:hypothetical protein
MSYVRYSTRLPVLFYIPVPCMVYGNSRVSQSGLTRRQLVYRYVPYYVVPTPPQKIDTKSPPTYLHAPTDFIGAFGAVVYYCTSVSNDVDSSLKHGSAFLGGEYNNSK